MCAPQSYVWYRKRENIMARFAKNYIKVAPGKMIKMAESIGADNRDDFNIYLEPCGWVAGYVETYGPQKGYYLRADLADLL